MPKDTESEVHRLTSLLSAAIKFSSWKQRDIEKTLGWSSGSLSRLLSGGIELKISHVVEICEVIQFPAARFFHAAYPKAEEGNDQAARIQRMLQEMYPAPSDPGSAAQPPAGTAPVSQEEIERMVHGALTRFFANLGGTPPGNPPRKK